jgi:hypothetical protein
MGISPFREEENAVPIKEDKSIPAGINWAKTMIIPKQMKNHIPKSPIPFTPPA